MHSQHLWPALTILVEGRLELLELLKVDAHGLLVVLHNHRLAALALDLHLRNLHLEEARLLRRLGGTGFFLRGGGGGEDGEDWDGRQSLYAKKAGKT